MKITLTFLLLLCLFTSANAQDFEFGKPTYDDYNYNKNKIDSNANVIVLKEFGTSRMELDDRTGYLNIIFEYHTKIKIYNKEGFSAANITIPIHKSGDREEDFSELQAITSNLENNGFVNTPIDRKAIFTENKSKYTILKKFTLPNIKEGSIIEYSYRLRSPFLFNFKTWVFQSQIPKVHSEYVAFIPPTHNYNVVLRGFYKLSDQKSEVSRECLRLSGVALDCSKLTYIMKNVPAFIEEDYMTAPSNFVSAMYFELSDVQYVNGSKQSYTKTWKDVDYDLVNDKKFGQQIKRKDVFKDLMPSILKDATDSLSKAKAVFDYIKKQIRWNNYNGQYCEESVKVVIDKRSGNVGDINLSLVAALNAAGLNAEAVILSTRENGVINKLFPVLSEFNYVIAKLDIGGTTYFADATDPLLPFGMLPLRCLNDQGRVITVNSKKPSYWIDLKATDKRTRNYFLDGEMDSEGKIKGTLYVSNYGYTAYNKRSEINRYTSTEEYVEKLDERLTGLKILKDSIANLQNLEAPLVEKFDIEMDNQGVKYGNTLAINPFIINKITKNPFNLNDRKYPVDMGSAVSERVTIKLKLPAQYDIKEQPQNLSLSLPENSGKYILNTTINDKELMITELFDLSKPIYDSEEYLFLKEFYSRIIQNQKADLQLKKN